MKDKFSFKRVALLLRYDWETCKKNLMFSVVIIEVVYIALSVDKYYSNIFGIEDPSVNVMSQFENKITGYTGLFFTAMMVLVVVNWIKILTAQIINTSSATRYMTIPANISERFTAIHLIFIIGVIGANILTFLNSVILKLIFIPSSLSGMFTLGFKNLNDPISVSITSILLFALAYLMFLNLLFIYKNRPKLKSILSIILIMVGYLVYFGVVLAKLAVLTTGSEFKEVIQNISKNYIASEQSISVIFSIASVFILIPVILQYIASFYCLKEKQIR